MSELNTFNLECFNRNFLKFRIKYYFYKTREAMLRHKLILVFLFCLAAPGFNHIKVIGVPFIAILDPSYSFIAKCISIFFILTFLSILIKSQMKSIQGGELRDYLFTLPLTLNISKKIDLVILIISLNITWLAFLFGAIGITEISTDMMLTYSYYILYLTVIVAIIVFLLNLLYRNIANMLFLTFLLLLAAKISIEKDWLLNIVLTLFFVLTFIIINNKIWPAEQKGKLVYSNRAKLNEFIIAQPFRLYCSILLASVRTHRLAFIMKTSICLLLTIVLMNIIFHGMMARNLFFILLVLISTQSYILSTLSTIFAKNELEFRNFHSLFQCNLRASRAAEIICMSGLFLFSLFPLILFILFIKPLYFLLITSIIIFNIIIIAINRMLYVYSFRFCFFTSFINSMISVVLQFLLIGA